MHGQDGPAAGSRLQSVTASEHPRALGDPDQAEPAAGPRIVRQGLAIDSPPVVANLYLDLAPVSLDGHSRLGRTRMLDDVVYALLHYAIDVDLGALIEGFVYWIDSVGKPYARRS